MAELRTDELPAQRAARGIPVQNFWFSLVFDDGTTREMLAYATPLKDEGRAARSMFWWTSQAKTDGTGAQPVGGYVESSADAIIAGT
jgi:hypothetical protein